MYVYIYIVDYSRGKVGNAVHLARIHQKGPFWY